jgi:hypothetical protein
MTLRIAFIGFISPIAAIAAMPQMSNAPSGAFAILI